MAYEVVWARCSVDNPETGESLIVNKGERLPEWVSDYTLFVLTSTGGVKMVADDAPLARPAPDPVRLVEHPPLDSDAALAERDTLAGDAAARLATARAGQGDTRPKDYASKGAWVDYAVTQRADGVSEDDARAEADRLSKTELISRYGKATAQADAVPAADEPDERSDDKATWLEYRINERVAQRPADQSEEDARAQAQAELEGKTKADLVAGL